LLYRHISNIIRFKYCSVADCNDNETRSQAVARIADRIALHQSYLILILAK